jgi:hypothetical protein
MSRVTRARISEHMGQQDALRALARFRTELLRNPARLHFL